MAAELKNRPRFRGAERVSPAELERVFLHYDEQLKQLIEDKDSLQSQITALEARVTALE